MNRDQLQGCGCLLGLLAGLAAIGVGGFFALIAFVTLVGWPIAAAMGLLLTASTIALVYFAVKFMVASRKRALTTGPYRGKLDEIDRLAGDVESAAMRAAGSEYGAQDILAGVRELKKRRDDVIHALVEVDAFLRERGNSNFRLQTESTYAKVRERLAGESVKPEYAENAARIRDVQAAVSRVKAERATLIANLDRIAIGLREIRARLLPTTLGAATGADIAKDLSRLTDAIVTEEKIKKELAAIEAETGTGPNPTARPEKLPH